MPNNSSIEWNTAYFFNATITLGYQSASYSNAYSFSLDKGGSNLTFSKNNTSSQTIFMASSKSGRMQFMGAVVIGNVNRASDAMLTVGGKLYARRLVVGAKWADFVFESNYKYLSLGELERFIAQNKHLPEIPSAEQVQAQGIDPAQMDMLLLQKIEELTLHLIEQKKQLDQQLTRIEALQNK